MQNVDWHRLFANKTVHLQVNLLNDIIPNAFTNFVPNKFITCDDRDPPWINDKTEDNELLTKAVSEVSQLIEKSKNECY